MNKKHTFCHITLITIYLGDKTNETKEKKKLLDTIRLPLVSVFPRKKKDDNLEQQTAQAGLASMETLDEKSTDGKSTELKNVSLVDKADVEKQETTDNTAAMCIKGIQAYKIAICKFLPAFEIYLL